MKKMLMNCKACNNEIAKGVKKCPSCGHDQRSFLGRHKVLAGVVVAIVIMIAAMGNGEDSGTAVTTSTDAKSIKTEAKTEKVVFVLGESAKSKNGAIVTVSNLKYSNYGEYDTKKVGMGYVLVTVTIKNTGTDVVPYNAFDYKMQNSKGQITDATYATINQDTQLQSGSLTTGGTVTGTLVFEQPKGDKALTLIYTGNIFSTDGIKFKVN